MVKEYFGNLRKFGGVEEILEVQEERPLIFYYAMGLQKQRYNKGTIYKQFQLTTTLNKSTQHTHKTYTYTYTHRYLGMYIINIDMHKFHKNKNMYTTK